MSTVKNVNFHYFYLVKFVKSVVKNVNFPKSYHSFAMFYVLQSYFLVIVI